MDSRSIYFIWLETLTLKHNGYPSQQYPPDFPLSYHSFISMISNSTNTTANLQEHFTNAYIKNNKEMKTQTQKDSLIKKTAKEGPNFEEDLSNKFLSRLSNKSRSKEEIILYVLKILCFILKHH